jgi:hypothetical protein
VNKLVHKGNIQSSITNEAIVVRKNLWSFFFVFQRKSPIFDGQVRKIGEVFLFFKGNSQISIIDGVLDVGISTV